MFEVRGNLFIEAPSLGHLLTELSGEAPHLFPSKASAGGEARAAR